jgi:hypothetical protein
MSKRLFALLVATLLAFAGCQSGATPAATPAVGSAAPISSAAGTPAASPTTAGTPALELVAADMTAQSLTLPDLRGLPVTRGQGGFKSSTGKITPPAAYSGVSLKDLAAKLPAFDATMGLSVEASDGYAITFSYDQVMNGTFTQYDTSTGDELKSPVTATAILAYESGGKALDAQTDGALRLMVVSAEPRQVVDGHWTVKFVTKVVAKLLSADWSLHLEGMLTEDMDRATFESGAAPNCHGRTWTDDKAQEWVGIPLWLLVGRVDDDIRHDGPAFNDELAAKGYTVDVVAADGYMASFDAGRIKRNDNILVAHRVNGNPLPDKYFPLRLVGSDVAKNEMVGQIAKIIVHLPGGAAPSTAATAAPSPSSTPADAGATGMGTLAVTGLVDNELTLTHDQLRALGAVTITAEHPKKGSQQYEGVRLNVLLDKAGVKADAKKIVITASDGFAAEVFLAEVRACADCLVAFGGGVLTAVMPGMPSNVWVKDVVAIDVR